MSDCRLVNAYGEVANEETQLNQLYLLKDLLIQIKILNEHMAKLSDEKISPEDVVAEGEISQ